MILRLSSALLLMASTSIAHAQDIAAAPTERTLALETGFEPDPVVIPVHAGGPLAAERASASCSGFVANAPNVRLSFAAGALPLVISATSDVDTVLVVNGPDGQWYCDDDSGGGEGEVDPRIVFDAADSGDYEIWVGTFDRGRAAARLSISEIDN